MFFFIGSNYIFSVCYSGGQTCVHIEIWVQQMYLYTKEKRNKVIAFNLVILSFVFCA